MLETKYANTEQCGFSELEVDDSNEPYVMEDLIEIPESMVIPWSGEDPTKELIDMVFHKLSSNASNSNYMMDRALLTPKKEYVYILNEKVIDTFPGKECIHYLFDSMQEARLTYINRSF